MTNEEKKDMRFGIFLGVFLLLVLGITFLLLAKIGEYGLILFCSLIAVVGFTVFIGGILQRWEEIRRREEKEKNIIHSSLTERQ
jgi:hypothetical protein